MRESELQLAHASNSMALIHDIRNVVSSITVRSTDCIQQVEGLVNRIDETLRCTPDAYVPVEWSVMAAGLRVITSQVACLAIAQSCEGDLVTARARNAVLFGELCRLISPDFVRLPEVTKSTRQVLLQNGECDFDRMRAFLMMIPLAPLYWHTRESQFSPEAGSETPESAPSPMLRVIVFLDHAPLASPQLLNASLIYPLVFRVRGLTWPTEAIRLRLDLLTTCPQSEFSVSEFSLDKPSCIEDGEYQGELAGHIKFNSGQGSSLDDLVFAVRAAFEIPDGDFTEIPVIGHNELRLRVVSEGRSPLMTGNRILDRHIVELVTRLISACPRVRDELHDLLDMLQALTRLLATFAQEAIYKGRSSVAEKEFQKTVLRGLRMVLGQDVQEHPRQAGGIPDVRFRGVIVELKVEKENGDRKHISKKYTAQPTQYAGVEARQVSILLVLDLSSKEKPPGDIRNDVLLTDVETHGGDDVSKGFPSKAFVFVINGNMKSPSSYSR